MSVNIQINDYSLQSDIIVTSKFSHDGSPDKELNTQKIARNDGMKLLSTNFAPKRFTLAGRIKGGSQDDLEENIDEFKRYVMNVTSANLDFEYAGSYRRFIVDCMSVSIERAHYHLTFAPFSVSFVVLDPPFGTRINSLGGDLVTLEALSVQQIAAAAYETTLTFDGSADPAPVMSFTIDTAGGLNEIQFRNQTTNQQMNVGTTWGNSDQLVIDTANRSVTRSGMDIDFSGRFPEFDLGANRILINLIQNNTLDQSQATNDAAAQISGNYIEEAQSFTPGSSTNYNKIQVLLRKSTDYTNDSQTELFSATTNKDAGNTTASWDTANSRAILPLAAAASDQTNTNTGGVAESLDNGLISYLLQKVTAAQSGITTKVTFKLSSSGSPTGAIKVKLYADSGGALGELLDTSSSVEASSLSGVATDKDFTFSGGPVRTSGQSYWYVLEWSQTSPGFSHIIVSVASTGTHYKNTPGTSASGALTFTDYYAAYTTASNIIQSTGYDTGYTTNSFVDYSVVKTDNSGSVIIEFSDSANNSSFGSWTSDITTLTRRYLRFRITITGTVSRSPSVDTLVMNYVGKLRARLWNTSAGLPTTQIEEILVPYSSIGTSYGIVDLNFTSVALSSASVYALSLVPGGADKTMDWPYANTSSVAGGQRLRRTSSGGTFTAFSTNDHVFYLYKTATPNWSVDAKVVYNERYL